MAVYQQDVQFDHVPHGWSRIRRAKNGSEDKLEALVAVRKQYPALEIVLAGPQTDRRFWIFAARKWQRSS